METVKFQELNLSTEILKAIEDMGFEEATPIQTKAIGIIRTGQDVLGQSQTGTGKTAAFAIPCLESININDKSLQALILCPTRELAIQVSEEFRKLLKHKEGIKVLPIYGGQPIDRQIASLRKGIQVVIGTPGRVIDHMKRHTLKTNNVKMVILDEADEMLDMGFREDIESILQKIPDERQTILFSATMPKGILELTKNYQNDPYHIKIIRKELTVPSIDQVYFEIREHNKMEALSRLIDMENPELSIVFCNTKKRVDELVEKLQGRGYFAEGLHGDLKQQQRDVVMKKFRNKTLEILVATDVAARGIDVENIDIVFNYDLPQDEEQYIHRVGRTGRAGKAGKAYTFVVGKEIYKLKDIMRYTKAKVIKQNLPTINDIEEIKSKAFIEEIKKTISKGHLAKYINMVESVIREEYETLDVAAALMKMGLFDKNANNENLNESSFLENKSNFKNDKNTTRLFINIGKKHKIRPKDILGAIVNKGNVPAKYVGTIDMLENFTFVNISDKYTQTVIKNMKHIKFNGNKLNIEIAKKTK